MPTTVLNVLGTLVDAVAEPETRVLINCLFPAKSRGKEPLPSQQRLQQLNYLEENVQLRSIQRSDRQLRCRSQQHGILVSIMARVKHLRTKHYMSMNWPRIILWNFCPMDSPAFIWKNWKRRQRQQRPNSGRSKSSKSGSLAGRSM
jgi:hypothetical protein